MFFTAVGVSSATEIIALVQKCVGPSYDVTGDTASLEANEDDENGGRTDDERRAADIESALKNSGVAAIVALRGGAWFTRVLSRIDFRVLDHRTRPVAFFGFSELTTLVNIVAAHPMGRGFYGMGPAFLTYGLKRYAAKNAESDSEIGTDTAAWIERETPRQFRAYFEQVTAMLEGREPAPTVEADCVSELGPLEGPISLWGGNLTVLSTMIGTRLDPVSARKGHWLVLEDFNDKIERFDRFLSHLTLSGVWDNLSGILLGDFHDKDRDLTPSVLRLLHYHLPPARKIPILSTPAVGHVWPMTPLPLFSDGRLRLENDRRYTLSWESKSTKP